MLPPKFRSVSILLLAVGIGAFGAFCVEAARKFITKDEALSRAEKLILKNGCSDLLPVKRRKRLVMNNQDFKTALEHELDCRAFAVYPERPENQPGWTVLFRLRYSCPECPQANRWRAVTMNEYGDEIRLLPGPFHEEPK